MTRVKENIVRFEKYQEKKTQPLISRKSIHFIYLFPVNKLLTVQCRVPQFGKDKIQGFFQVFSRQKYNFPG